MKKIVTGVLLFALLLLPGTALAQAPPDGSPTDQQYQGDTDGPTVIIEDPPVPDQPDDGDPGALDGDADIGAVFDDDADDGVDDVVADASAVAEPAGPASPTAAAATTSATASASPTARSEALPETGGVGGIALAAGALLLSTGLLARRVISRG